MTDECHVTHLFSFLKRPLDFWETKNRTHKWQNLENLSMKQIAELLKKNHRFFCYLIALSKKISTVFNLVTFQGKVFKVFI